MSSWFGRWFGYGLGAVAGKAIFSDDSREGHAARDPIRQQTEAEIRADERRYDDDAKLLEAQAEAETVAKKHSSG